MHLTKGVGGGVHLVVLLLINYKEMSVSLINRKNKK